MRLLLVTLAFLACAAPARAAACDAVDADGGRKIAKAASGDWFECRSERSFRARGRLLHFAASRVAAAAVIAAPGGRTRVVTLELRRGKRGRAVDALRPGQRVRALTVHREVAYYAIAGPAQGIHTMHPVDDMLPFHLHPAVAPATLRRTGGRLSWREAGAARHFDLRRGRHVPPKTCAVPPYGHDRRTAGAVTTFELRLENGGEYTGEVFACVPGAPPFSVGGTDYELGGTSIEVMAVDGERAVFMHTSSWKESRYVVAVFDVRSGTRLAGWTLVGWSGCIGVCTRLVFGSFVISAGGRLAVGLGERHIDSSGTEGTPVNRVVVVDQARLVTLDDAAAVDIHSLRLEGTTLSWRHGDERRTAPFE